MKTGIRIKYFRQLREISREELANSLNLTKFAIAKYEQGQRSPELNTLKKISEILDIPFTVLSGSILNEFAIQLDKSIKFQHETLESLSEQLSISLQDIQNVYNGFLDKVPFEVLDKIAVSYKKNINELLYWSSDFFILKDIKEELNKREKMEKDIQNLFKNLATETTIPVYSNKYYSDSIEFLKFLTNEIKDENLKNSFTKYLNDFATNSFSESEIKSIDTSFNKNIKPIIDGLSYSLELEVYKLFKK